MNPVKIALNTAKVAALGVVTLKAAKWTDDALSHADEYKARAVDGAKRVKAGYLARRAQRQ